MRSCPDIKFNRYGGINMAMQYEWELEEEMSPLHEHALEADPFFGALKKRLGRVAKGIVKMAAPALKRLAPMAARLVAGAIPGVGAITGPLAGRLVGALTREQQEQLESALHEAIAPHPEWESAHPEYEAAHPEYQPEYHPEYEASNLEYHPEYEAANPEWESALPEYEAVNPEWESVQMEYEAIHPEYESGLQHSEMTHQEAVLMEQIAYEATQTASEAEAEALGGSLVPLATRAVRAASPALRTAAPALARATGRLVGALRRSPTTRPLIRTVPTILRLTNAALAQQAAQGAPVSPRTAVRTMANQTYRVIGNPAVCIHILIRSGHLRRRGVARPRPEAMPY
jgi:hypothetical protein